MESHNIHSSSSSNLSMEDTTSKSTTGGFPLSAVPELLGAENWALFRRKIEEYLVLANLWDVVNEAEPREEGNQLIAWKIKQKIVCTSIKSRCSFNPYSLVKSLEDPKEILDTLEKNSKLHGTGILTELYKQLDNLRLSEFKGVLEYTTVFREIDAKLKNLGTNAALTDV